MIVGVDEAGRGPLAGCVVSCALYIKDYRNITLPLKDSKSISHQRRQHFFEHFRHNAEFCVGMADAREIDTHNILRATHLSFNRAIASLLAKAPYLKKATFIIDGNTFATDLAIAHRCMVKADLKVREVAYASIVAKLFRDYLMEIADFIFPAWNFRQHKGYPTAEHRGLIKKHKLSPLHRKSFCNSL